MADPLMERLEREGWTRELAQEFHDQCHEGREASVCVLCGWPWPGPNNRCVNTECNGFCTWGSTQGADPASWERHPDDGDKPMGEARFRPRAPESEGKGS